MDLEAEYNNLKRVPDSADIITRWAAHAARFRAAHPHKRLDLQYGVTERARLDLFRPGPEPDAPLALFIHGGYWQRLGREFVSHFARGLLARGVAVAVPSYDLCPYVTMDVIIDQMRQACAFLHRRTTRRILAMGHSAGGHLAAMLAATDWRAVDPALPADLVPALLPISGVFDLAPLIPTSINEGLRLGVAEAVRLSPLHLKPPAPRGVHAVVGGDESGEFRRQTGAFAAAWGGSAEEIAGVNHFSVLDSLLDPDSSIVARAVALLPG